MQNVASFEILPNFTVLKIKWLCINWRIIAEIKNVSFESRMSRVYVIFYLNKIQFQVIQWIIQFNLFFSLQAADTDHQISFFLSFFLYLFLLLQKATEIFFGFHEKLFYQNFLFSLEKLMMLLKHFLTFISDNLMDWLEPEERISLHQTLPCLVWNAANGTDTILQNFSTCALAHLWSNYVHKVRV